MRTQDITALTLLGAIWGASFIFIEIAARELPAPFLMGIRVGLAAIVLFTYLRLRSEPLTLRPHLGKFLILGTINSALPFTLIAFAQSNPSYPASLGAILNSPVPLFTAVIAAFWLGQGLTSRKILGVLLGVMGVAVISGWSPIELTPELILSGLASLGAALFYGFGTVYAKKYFQGVSTTSMAVGQLMGATVFIAIPATVTAPSQTPSSEVAWAVVILAILCTSTAYLLYFYLLKHVGPTKTTSVTFLVPGFAIVWGALFLQETISISMIVGLVIILTSVFLVISEPATEVKPSVYLSQ